MIAALQVRMSKSYLPARFPQLIPLIQGSLYRRQPVDGDGIHTVIRHSRGQRDGGRVPVCHPVPVDQVQVAVHPSHLVGSEMVGAVVI